MKRILFKMFTVPALFVVASLATGVAFAQNGHYIKLDPSLDTNTACYEVNLKEAGLGGSGALIVQYGLSGTGSFTTVCVNHGGNQVQGQPKSCSPCGTATQTTFLPVRNGSTSGTVSLCPSSFTLPNPGCTGSQKLVIIAASYSNLQLIDNLPSTYTAGVQTSANGLVDIGSPNLFVPVP